jgi:hypothetical protein
MRAEIQQNYDINMYLFGAGCVVRVQVCMDLGSRSKVWNPGTWIRCVLHCPVLIFVGLRKNQLWQTCGQGTGGGWSDEPG